MINKTMAEIYSHKGSYRQISCLLLGNSTLDVLLALYIELGTYRIHSNDRSFWRMHDQ